VVVIVEGDAAVEGEVVQRVREEVAAVLQDGVHLPRVDPEQEGEEMGPQDDCGQEGAHGQEHDLDRVRVVARESERRLELVVLLVTFL